jgi:glycosyltransferase involved in cell wall biosynthesis
MSVRQSDITCIVNNYNYEHFVSDAIESALRQTHPFRQIIVVDDGSSDRSRDVIKRYVPSVTLIETANYGQTAACLTGLSMAESDFVYFLDSDDYVSSTFVETISEVLRAHAGAVKIQCQLVTVDEAGRMLGSFPTFPENYAAAAMAYDNATSGYYLSPPTSGNVFRRSTLSGLKTEHLNRRAAIDGTLNLIMPYIGEVISLNKPLAFKRVHQRSAGRWGNPTPELLENETSIFMATWSEALTIMGRNEAPFIISPPIYVRERELMRGALLGRRNLCVEACNYIAAIAKRGNWTREAVLLCVWSLFLCIPMASWRERAIKARRSPQNRSAVLDALVRWFARKGGSRP